MQKCLLIVFNLYSVFVKVVDLKTKVVITVYTVPGEQDLTDEPYQVREGRFQKSGGRGHFVRCLKCGHYFLPAHTLNPSIEVCLILNFCLPLGSFTMEPFTNPISLHYYYIQL